MAMDAHPEAREETTERIAVESFLKGCRDNEAAQSAMNKDPTSINKASMYMKDAINNRTALFGSKPSFQTRQVSFADEDEDDIRVRHTGKQNIDSTRQTQLDTLVSVVSDLARKVEMLGRANRSRTPSPAKSPQRRKCYRSDNYGHLQRDSPIASKDYQ